MSRGRFTASIEDWMFAEPGGPEQFVAYLDELAPDEQRRVLATAGMREVLIDCGQEQALRRIEDRWSGSAGAGYSRRMRPINALAP